MGALRQTAGGRAPLPAPRTVAGKPFIQLGSPPVWTTLSLTLHADGSAEHDLAGASSVPRHWIYDAAGNLSLKSGLVEFKDWYQHAYGTHTPWGDEDSPAVVTQVETVLERTLSRTIMRDGAKPRIRRIETGETLVDQGDAGYELYLLLDGVLSVEVDGEPLVELGPGAIVGERAVLEGGRRTATLRAVTACSVAVAGADAIDRAKLEELARGPSPGGRGPRLTVAGRQQRESMTTRNTALAALDTFVGEWSMAAHFPHLPPAPGEARVAFEWLPGRQFLVQRWSTPVPEAPDGIAIIGLDPSSEGRYLQHYFDSRGVARVYRMTLAGGGKVWTLWRHEADFSPLDFRQRYTGTVSDDGQTITGAWEICHDGETWEHDFELSYTRIS